MKLAGTAFALVALTGPPRSLAAGPKKGPSPFEADGHTVLLLHLDEARGTVVTNAADTALTGTVHGATWTEQEGSGHRHRAASAFGSSLHFDGRDDVLEIPHDPRFNFGAGDFTIEAWVRVSRYLGFPVKYGCVVSHYVGGGPGYRLAISPEGHLRFSFLDAAGNRSNHELTFSIEDGIAHCVRAIRKGNRNIIVIDNQRVWEQTVEGVGSTDCEAPLLIGALRKTVWHFAGVLDEIRISNIAREPVAPPEAAEETK